MSKAITGAAMLVGAIALEYFTGGAASPLLAAAIQAMAAGGISMEAAAISEALANQRGLGITVRQAAGLRQVVYGEQRIGGTIVYQSTTGFGNTGLPLYNLVIALAGHQIDSIVNLYLDGRQVFWQQTSNTSPAFPNTANPANTTRNGINFGGIAANDVQANTPGAVLNTTPYGQHPYYGMGLGYGIGPGGNHYQFAGKVYCEARYGDQLPGDIVQKLAATDPNWAANVNQSPYGGGCTYVFLQIGYDSTQFPNFPEIRFTVRGKNDIYDPRTGGRSFSANWALIVADAITDADFGLGDTQDCVATAQITPVQPGGIGTVITGGTLAGITLVSGGGGYTTPPTVTIAPPLGPGYCYPAPAGTLTMATATAILGSGPTAGEVVGFNITNPGAGYTTQPLITVTPSPNAAVNQAQLIAAANVCDEDVLTSAGFEQNYQLNLHYDTGTSPGAALAMMMPAAAGRISRIGGQWFIWPAYWQGPSFVFDQGALVGTPTWMPNRSFKELFNRVNGTYIAPNYPYNNITRGEGGASDLYDSNGWWYGQTEDTWPLAWQPTSYPQYAHDALHGFGYDEFLAQDGGILLPKDLSFRSVISIVQAQRVAKINLMRNRQQGSGSFPMSLAAWQMQPTDVMQFTFPVLGWTNKVLEISGDLRFQIEEQESEDEGGERALAVSLVVPVNETDPSVYEWNGVQASVVGQDGWGYTSAPTVSFNPYLDQPYATLYNNGVLQVILTNPMTLYTTTPTVTFSGGGGSGASATAVLGATQPGGGQLITGFTINAAGSGYSTAPTVTLSGGGVFTTNATATAQLYGMAIGGLSITNGGHGYTTAPAVTINGTGQGATAYAVLTAGVVTEIVLLNTGYGYTGTPTVSIAAPPVGGTQATATASLAGSSVLGIALTSGGAGSGGGLGYTSPPTVTFSAPQLPGGYSATATASISGGVVTGFTLTNPGYGYTSAPTITLSGGGGSGASAQAIGALFVTSATITNGGLGYTSAPTLNFTGGGGSGAGGYTAVSGGAVDQITITTEDYPGYQSVPSISFSGGGGSGAAATAVCEYLLSGVGVAGGAGYTTSPTVTLSAPGLSGGVQATATATVAGGQVTGFTIVTQGSGYLTPPTVSLSGGGGTGASGTAYLASSTVAGFTITNPGAGWLQNPNVIISGGGGYGASATTSIGGGQILTLTPGGALMDELTLYEELSPYDVPVSGAPPEQAGTVAVGSAAGSGATGNVVGSTLIGQITILTGATGLAAGTLCTVTFQSALPHAPTVLITASGISSGVVSGTATTTVATFVVSAALLPSTLYQIGYELLL
jgi:hypothetical protein